MKKIKYILPLAFFAIVLFVGTAAAQRGENETFTGTVISYGSGFNTRTTTNTFTLNLTGRTTDADAKGFLAILQNDGQDKLLEAVRHVDLGNFSMTGSLGRRVNGVRISQVHGKTRIRIIFERWLNVGEIRGGYRSVDYPFGYIELFIDPQTGKGEGTLIAAARIRFKTDKKSGEEQVEIEDFGTYPSRLIGVTMRGRKLS